MRKKRRSVLRAFGVAIVVTGLFAAAPSASASGSKCNPGCEAQVEFRSKGEILTVHDYARDGHSAVALVQVRIDGVWFNKNGRYGVNGHFWNRSGFDAPPKVYNISIIDGREVRYRACTGEFSSSHPNSGALVECSVNWRYDRA